MSRHSVKSRQRHPDAQRETFGVAHVTFELAPDAKTFALIAGQAESVKDRRPLFTGIIEPDMPAQLCALADRVAEIIAAAGAADD